MGFPSVGYAWFVKIYWGYLLIYFYGRRFFIENWISAERADYREGQAGRRENNQK